MLVLGREIGECIVLNNNIIIRLIKSDEGKFKLAIDAPKEVTVLRGEVWEKQTGRKLSDGFK